MPSVSEPITPDNPPSHVRATDYTLHDKPGGAWVAAAGQHVGAIYRARGGWVAEGRCLHALGGYSSKLLAIVAVVRYARSETVCPTCGATAGGGA